MGYISIEFFCFSAITLLLYYIFPKKQRWMILLVASVYFYISYDSKFLLLFAVNTFLTYLSGYLMDVLPQYKKYIISISIPVVIFYWIYLKFPDYFSFPVASFFSLKYRIIPIGLSYFIIQSLSYMLDIYRGEKAERNILKYSLFLLWFPAIIQGPISRYRQLIPELTNQKKFDSHTFTSCLLLILFGLIKKMIIADHIALYVGYVYKNLNQLYGIILYVGMLAFAIQLYMDFSGCVDICRGVSGLFGIHLQMNFNAPYFAKSIKEFWGKWHISFSSWLKDYVYIPLGGNRKGRVRKYFNILIVFLVSGIWHGTGYTFIVWGMLHAIYQIVGEITFSWRQKVKKLFGIQKNSLSEHIFQVLITFHLVLFAWIFFRSSSLSIAVRYILHMFSRLDLWNLLNGTLYSVGMSHYKMFAVFLNVLLVCCVDYCHSIKHCDFRENILSLHVLLRWPVYFILIYDILLFGAYGSGVAQNAFLYGGF